MAKLEKLVRDNIPDMIQNEGRKPITRTLSDDEYTKELEKKLQEEVTEYIGDKNVDELADILEVVYSLAGQHGMSREDLEVVREKKAIKNGGFQKRIFLLSIET